MRVITIIIVIKPFIHNIVIINYIYYLCEYHYHYYEYHYIKLPLYKVTFENLSSGENLAGCADCVAFPDGSAFWNDKGEHNKDSKLTGIFCGTIKTMTNDDHHFKYNIITVIIIIIMLVI